MANNKIAILPSASFRLSPGLRGAPASDQYGHEMPIGPHL